MTQGRLSTVLRCLRGSGAAAADGGLTDRQLLDRFARRGEETAFEALVRRHGALVLGVCRRLLSNRCDVEDVFQATFLVLARKAASIRWQDSVGSWLYSVAYRLALKCRVDAARRKVHEQQAAELPRADSLSEMAWRELRSVLDEELQRLPEKYRAPLLLCYLEGLTNEEAARQLGWPRGTVSGRLARARELLRLRLQRRGVSLSGGLLALLLAEHALAAATPATLATATARQALAFAAGPAGEGGISAAVLTLTRAALTVSRVKVAVVLLTVGLLTGAALVAHRTLVAKPPPIVPEERPEPAKQPRPAPTGKPAPTDRHGDPLPPQALLRLGTLRFRQEGEVSAVAYSPDGKLLASTSDRGILLWDAASGKERRRLRGLARSLDFSPDGKLLAGVASYTGELRLWDATTGKPVRRIMLGRRLPGERVRFSPDGKLLAVAGLDDTVLVFETATGKKHCQMGGHRAAVYGLAFSPDGRTLALGTLNPSVQLWDVNTGKLVRGIAGDKHFAMSLAFSADGKVLASGSWDQIILSDPATGKELGRLTAPKMESVNGLAFTPDGKTLVSGSQDARVRLWDVAARKERLRLDPQMWVGRSMALTRDGRRVALGTAINTVRQWEVATGKEVGARLEGHEGQVNCVAFAPDGKRLVTADDNRQIRIWDPASGKTLRALRGTSARAIAFAPDGQRFATIWTWNPVVRLCDAATGKPVLELAHPGVQQLRAFAFAPDGKTLVTAALTRTAGGGKPSGRGTGSLHVWEAATGKQLRVFQLPEVIPESLAYSPDERTVALGETSAIRLWDMESGREFLALKGHEHSVETLAFAPDGRVLLSGSLDQTARLWEVASGREILTFRRHTRAVGAVAFAPDGRRIATAGGVKHYPIESREPHTIRLWDPASGQEILRLRGHDADVTALAFSPDGQRLAAGLRNTTTLIWDVKPRGAPAARELGQRELEQLWTDLGANDAARGYRATWTLAASPQKAVPFLKDRLPPAAQADPARMARLIGDLDSVRFAVRQAAFRALEQLADQAVPLLREVLAKNPSVELRKRVEMLLARPRVVRSPEVLRRVRAIQALERIGTPSARSVLQTLAGGAPLARETEEARASLKRLAVLPR
jgi:RNA polymerase sigma factor (sigma-70 family)